VCNRVGNWVCVVFCCHQQTGAVTNQPMVNAPNARMNAAVMPRQATVGNVVIRPLQSTTVVRPAAANAARSPASVVGGRIVVSSAAVAHRPAVPVNASVAGMFVAKRVYLKCYYLHQGGCFNWH